MRKRLQKPFLVFRQFTSRPTTPFYWKKGAIIPNRNTGTFKKRIRLKCFQYCCRRRLMIKKMKNRFTAIVRCKSRNKTTSLLFNEIFFAAVYERNMFCCRQDISPPAVENFHTPLRHVPVMAPSIEGENKGISWR